LEVSSQHPEKLRRNRAVPRKSIATGAGSKSDPSRILLNIRLLSEVRFSGHKRPAPPKRSMTLAALASPEAPEIPLGPNVYAIRVPKVNN
jgi:hypothetical protein